VRVQQLFHGVLRARNRRAQRSNTRQARVLEPQPLCAYKRWRACVPAPAGRTAGTGPRWANPRRWATWRAQPCVTARVSSAKLAPQTHAPLRDNDEARSRRSGGDARFAARRRGVVPAYARRLAPALHLRGAGARASVSERKLPGGTSGGGGAAARLRARGRGAQASAVVAAAGAAPRARLAQDRRARQPRSLWGRTARGDAPTAARPPSPAPRLAHPPTRRRCTRPCPSCPTRSAPQAARPAASPSRALRCGKIGSARRRTSAPRAPARARSRAAATHSRAAVCAC
jgi:hypothetical protein